MGLFDFLRKKTDASAGGGRGATPLGPYGYVLARIEEARRDGKPWPADAVNSLLALLGKSETSVFGMTPDALHFSEQERAEVMKELGDLLRARWRAAEADGDRRTLYQFSRVAKAVELPELALPNRFALLCDPLGARDALSPAWRARVEVLERVVRGERALDFRAVGYESDGDEVPVVTFGDLAPEALYDLALRFELETERPFSREIAAMWSVANGICFDDVVWFFEPVAEWRWDLGDLELGSGPRMQGRLVIHAEAHEQIDLMAARVVAIDDDGEEVREWHSFAALVDDFLGPR